MSCRIAVRQTDTCARWVAGLACALIPVAAAFAAPADPPFLGRGGAAEFRAFLDAPDHSAFAVAPGGGWGWSSGAPSAALAREQAMARCAAHASVACVPYAANGKLIFDESAWARGWQPYAGFQAARRAKVGTARGARAPDLAFVDAPGRRQTLSSLRGKVVLVHFWGSWCPPCRDELQDLARLQVQLADRDDIVFVVLQVREPIAQSRRWARDRGVTLPLADSGVEDDADGRLRLAGGGTIADRDVASVFPSTWVVDKRGIVVFSQAGPVHGWTHHASLLRDVAAHSGK